MKRNLISKVGGLVLAGSLISGYSATYQKAYSDDKGLGAKVSVNNSNVADESLKKRSEKYENIFNYVKDENSKNYELRMKTDKLNEKEKAEFISMKGTDYNEKKGYISFNSEFEDKKLYSSMKNLAILSQVYQDNIISDEEKKFLKKEAPDVYSSLFQFEGRKEKNEIKSEEKKKKDYKPEDHPFIQGLVNFYFNARLKSEEKKWADEIKKINIVEGLRKSNNNSINTKEKDKKFDNIDEAPKAPEKN